MSCEVNIRVLTTWKELEEVQLFWENNVRHPNAEYWLFSRVLRSRSEVVSPYVIVICQQAHPRALVLCRLEDTPCSIGLGYWTLARPAVRTLVVMHGGVLGELDSAGAALVLEFLRKALALRVASRIWLNAQPDNSPLAEVALRATTPWCRGYLVDRSGHWRIEIPAQPGGALARMKSKHRSWLMRMKTEMDSCFTGTVRYACFRGPTEIPDAIADIEAVAKKTYQRGLGVGPRDVAEYRDRYLCMANAGRLRIWLLYAGKRPLAFRIGFVYGETIHGGGIGHDPEMSRFRPGTLLLLHTLDDLAQEGIKYYDLGLGDADYKRQFGQLSHNDVSFSIFADSLSGLCAKVAIAVSGRANRCLKRAGAWLDVAGYVKKRWRLRLTAEPRE